jgi:NADH:ubiquinone reductase (H+-translocating)
MNTKNIIIVGGGFAGINLAKQLAGDMRFNVVLVDKNNYHFFPPLLYQVATAFIETSNITYPYRRMFQQKENVRFYNGSLIKIIPSENIIETDNGILAYDYLVLAMGTETNYFGMKNVKEHSTPMKTIDDAINLRNRLLLNIEKATRTKNEAERKGLSNIVIAGGGPTGVELAGMLAEMAKQILGKDYPEMEREWGSIYLVDSSKSLLSPMSVSSQREAFNTLRKLGVQIQLDVSVKDYTDGSVVLSNGETISTPVLIWTSGVIAKEAPGLPAESIGSRRRIAVNEYNKVEGTENIFAIGDICLLTTDKKYPGGHPQLAQVAIQQGKLLAQNFKNMEAEKPAMPFSYKNKGSMAIISKYRAVVDLPKGFFKGYLAWFAWLFIHLIPIAGFRNKIKLSTNWVMSFLTNDPALRVIIRPEKSREAVI